MNNKLVDFEPIKKNSLEVNEYKLDKEFIDENIKDVYYAHSSNKIDYDLLKEFYNALDKNIFKNTYISSQERKEQLIDIFSKYPKEKLVSFNLLWRDFAFIAYSHICTRKDNQLLFELKTDDEKKAFSNWLVAQGFNMYWIYILDGGIKFSLYQTENNIDIKNTELIDDKFNMIFKNLF